jgi:hypothetical protein
MPKGKRVFVICLVLATGLIMNVVAFGRFQQSNNGQILRAPVRQNKEQIKPKPPVRQNKIPMRAPVRSNPATSPDDNATNTHPVIKTVKKKHKRRHRRRRHQ